jgi:octaprenyl-diphosphate synthase
MDLRQIYNSIKGKIDQVENLLHREYSSELPILKEMAGHVISSGGKRIRPALLCLAARALGYVGDKDVEYGAVFELVHTATLVHDDIIDNADVRRGKRVLHHKYGTTMSILFGDHLYNKAMEIAIREDDFRVVRLLNKATEKMIGGEILQYHRNFTLNQNLDDYIDLIQRKTAWIFAGCSQTAAIITNAGETLEKNLFDYGMNLGMAFQIIDDYFDYSSSEKKLGKPVGSDLLEGKITYPVFLMFEEKPELKKLIKQGFKEQHFDSQFISELVEEMNEIGVLEKTKDVARQYAGMAVKSLEKLPENKSREALEELPLFVVEREK